MEFAFVRQSITNCISKFIQCEDWMLTGPTSKRVPFNRRRSTNKTSRRFDFPNSSITASESSVMIEIGKKKWRQSRAAAPRVRDLVRGISLRSGGRVWGWGCAPSPENFWDFCLKMGHFDCILPYARFFRSSKGGAWPKWPNGKYASAASHEILMAFGKLFNTFISKRTSAASGSSHVF